MGDIGRVLYTAQQAILSNLSAINVTGANISNVNTEGYTRLRPIFEAVGSSNATSSQEQIGVRIADIERVYDRFLDAQIVSQNSSVSSATARKDLLTQIEGILNESTGNGVNDALSAFWSSWDNLSANPSGQAERDAVVSAGQNLTYIFNQRADELLTIQNNADQTIADDVDKLNGYLNDMSSLNAQIATAESAGGTASALRDNRTALLGKISSLIDINYVEQSDGSLYIYLPESGKALVQGTNDWQLKVQRNSSNLNDIVFANDPSTSLNAEITGGELGGLLNVRDFTLPSYINDLNQTASSIINKVNAQHMAGYDEEGNIGLAFFTPTTQAKDMAVNTAIVTNTIKIAASATVNADGDNATAMTALKDDQMYASLGQINKPSGTSVTGLINNVGQAYKDTTLAGIKLTRGANSSDWTVTDNGGYSLMPIGSAVLSANANSITLDLNGDKTADITLNLSGTWAQNDTISFSLAKQGSTTTIGGYYNAFIAKVGQDASSSSTDLDREKAIATQNNTQREQLSGVSLDEEMLNLIKYQMAYNAASRMTKTISDMMDILINLGQ
ncbi:MAG: flagellar hook-associated protein FlgK [Smithella sp.]